MLRFFFIVFFLCYLQKGWTQDTPLTTAEKASLDSMFANDEFFKLADKNTGESYVEVSAGISNGVFSLRNNSVNAEQATTNKLFYTPSLSYYHKSGLAISAGSYFASDSGQLKIFQYLINPSYSYYSTKVNAGISYTRYIAGQASGFDVNPFKNDLYSSIVFKKPWLRPAVGLGYSSGKSKEYFDSVITFVQIPRTVTIRDTITSKLSSFSLGLSVSHIWSFRKIFFKKDEIEIQPAFLANASNQKLVVSHSGSLNHRRPVVQNLLKSAYGNGTANEKFSLQSFAFLLGITYGKGKFTAQPQLNLDYYLHDTAGKKLSAIYSFNISYDF